MIEGGIAGSINLRTRLPFDAPGQLIQIGARANYGDLDKKVTPDINGFYSNRWQTASGEFGIMGNIAFSQVKTRSQGIQYGRTAIVMNRRRRLARGSLRSLFDQLPRQRI